MSELLHVILEVFKFLTNVTIDCICLAAYLMAFASGVRTVPALGSLSLINSRKDFREEAMSQFLLIFYDLFAYFCFFGSLIAPWRIYPVIASIVGAWKEGEQESCGISEMNCDLRSVAIGQFFITLLDLVCVPLGILPLFAPWRTYKVIQSYIQVWKDHTPGDYRYNFFLRMTGILQLFYVLVDIPIIIIGLFGLLVPWRTYYIIKSLLKANEEAPKPETRYNWTIRVAAVAQTILSMYDIFLFLISGIMVISLYKIPRLWEIVNKKEGYTYNDDIFCSLSKRYDIFVEFLIWCLDLFFLPVVLLLLMTWRAPKIISILKDDKTKFLQRRFRCMAQIFYLLIDIPFVLMAFFVVATLWRLPALYRAIKMVDKAKKYRMCCLVQFALLFRDIPVFILFFINCAFLYPIPRMISKIITLSKQPLLNGTPALNISSYRIESCQEGGYRFHIKGTKESGFTFTSAKLHVLGDLLWQVSTDICGSGKIFIGKSMLPMELIPDSLSLSSIPAEATEFQTDIHFGLGNVRLSKRLLSRFMTKIKDRRGGVDIHLHVEYDNRKGILFDVHLKPEDIIATLESTELSPVPEAPVSDGKEAKILQYHEIFFSVVIEYTLFLLRDIAGVLGIIRLLLQPNKFWEAMQSFYESPERQTARKLKHSLSILKSIFVDMETLQNRFDDAMERCLSLGHARHNAQGVLIYITVNDDPFFGTKSYIMSQQFKYIQSTGCPESSLVDDITKKVDEAYELRLQICHLQYMINTNSATTPNPEQELVDLKDSLKDTRRLLKDAREALANSEIQIPAFWATSSTKHRTWSDKCGIVFSIVYESTLDFFGFMALLFLAVTVVRIIPALVNIKKDWYIWRELAFHHVVQLFTDILYLLMYLIVVVLIRHSLNVTFEAATEIYITRGVTSARSIIFNRFNETYEDILYLLSFITAWKTYQFILAIVVWGLLGPADMFSGLLAHMGLPKNIRKPLSIIVWLGGLVAAPIITFKVIPSSDNKVEDYSDSIKLYLSYVTILLIPILYYASREKSALEKEEIAVEYHYNVYNAAAVLHLFVEAYQNISVVWKIDDGSFDEIGSPAFLTFDDWWNIAFYIGFFVVLLWFFFVSSPMVVEEMLDWKSTGYFAKNPLWGSIMFLTGRTLMFYVTVSFLTVLNCKEIGDDLVLSEDFNVRCFTSDKHHNVIATIALIFLAFYIPTTADASIKYFSAKINKNLDVSFTSFYVIVGIIYNILVAALRVFSNDRDVGLGLLIGLNGFMFCFTILYEKIFESDCTPLPVISAIRSCGYAFPLVAAIIQSSVDTHSEKALYAAIFVPVCAAIFFALFSIGALKGVIRDKKSGVVATTRAEMREAVMAISAIPTNMPAGTFMDSWSLTQSSWIRKVRLIKKPPHPLCEKCNRAGELAALLILLDSYTKYTALYPNFVATRANWRTTTENAKTIHEVLIQARDYVAGVRGAPVFQMPNVANLAQGNHASISLITRPPPPVFSADGQRMEPAMESVVLQVASAPNTIAMDSL